ncbi:unnamed protein product [Didymodactylos carnosus]|uniref:Uncharacterized protein n=1 Tax=Didymodactylos carnosus TaxID=1234261 RepID=A0A8S2DJI9_9BILA|nr:unnamed protein product [Didymodactylos carnosus]CAF3747242.1 unnamed protein product [Didymodactylos carnosus]
MINQRRNFDPRFSLNNSQEEVEPQNSMTTLQSVSYERLKEMMTYNNETLLQQWHAAQHSQQAQTEYENQSYLNAPIQTQAPVQQRSPGVLEQGTPSKRAKVIHNTSMNNYVSVQSQHVQNDQIPDQFQQNSQHQTNIQQETYNNEQRKLSWNVLKYATSHELPPFIVKFEDEENLQRNRLPGAIHVKSLIQNDLLKAGIKFGGFSLIRPVGKRFKLYVNSRDDYHKLLVSDKWPENCGDKKIFILKPKFIPSQFSLVVRNVPQALPKDTVEREINYSITTATNLRILVSKYPKKTVDYRFDVPDLAEYKLALEQGVIGVGNVIRQVTEYIPANRVLYCSKCWLIGHRIRDCQEPLFKCRTCLNDLTPNQHHECSLKTKCAQCNNNHLSTAPTCPINQKYRDQLNYEVKQAITEGKIEATLVNNRPVVPSRNSSEYPLLNEVYKPTTSGWKINRNNQVLDDQNTDDVYRLIRTHQVNVENRINEMGKVLNGFLPAVVTFLETIVKCIAVPMADDDLVKQQIKEECKKQLDGVLKPILVISKSFMANFNDQISSDYDLHNGSVPGTLIGENNQQTRLTNTSRSKSLSEVPNT